MKNIKTLIIRKLVSKFLRMRCPSRIPRSGKEGEAQNCFSVRITKEQDPFFLVNGLDERCLKGEVWSGTKYEIDASIPFSLLDHKDIEITHYYGLSTIKYSGIWDYIIHGLTKKEYIKINLMQFFSRIWQYYFNKQKLVMLQRHELLKVLVDFHIKSAHKGIHSIDLMTKLYSINWVLHPEGSEQNKKLDLYLESFVNSGELRKSNREYYVTSNAIMTLAKYEEEERRHKNIVNLQKKMVLLTLILAFLAMVQAGIIKFPTLLDLSQLFKGWSK
jgi:hypothetical protein